MSTHATGPRTDDGKARSSMNAVKHGLRAETIVLPHESADEWEALRAAVHAEYRPRGLIETDLVERIAESMWRLRRPARYEVEAWDAEDRDKALARVIRYEAHISRQLNQALRMLRELPGERASAPPRPAPTPVVPPTPAPEKEASSFGKSGTNPTEVRSFGARAEAVITKRLAEIEQDTRRLKDRTANHRPAVAATTT